MTDWMGPNLRVDIEVSSRKFLRILTFRLNVCREGELSKIKTQRIGLIMIERHWLCFNWTSFTSRSFSQKSSKAGIWRILLNLIGIKVLTRRLKNRVRQSCLNANTKNEFILLFECHLKIRTVLLHFKNFSLLT